jgi:putative PEP-CTERM system TPR-repeat lipoprotein
MKVRLYLILCLAALLHGCSKEASKDFVANGRAFLDKGQITSAVIELKNAVESEPGRADVRYLLGLALQRNGEFAAAEIELRKAGTLGYDANLVKPALMTLLLESGRPKESLNEGSLDGITQPEAKAEIIAKRGDGEFALGRGDAAEKLYAESASIFAANETAAIGKARVALMRGDRDGARKMLEQVLATNPKSLTGLLMLGDLLGKDGKTADAVSLLDRAFDLRPTDMRAFGLAIPLLINSKDLTGAKARLERMRKVLPRAVLTMYFDALIAYTEKRKEFARDKVLQVVRLLPDDPRGLLLAGMLEFDLGNYRHAEQYLAKVVTARPTDAQPRMLLATTYVRSGNIPFARKALEPLLNGEIVDPSIHDVAGEIAFVSGDMKRAIQHFEKAVAMDPRSARYRTLLGQARLRDGNVAAGTKDLEEATAADPSQPQASLVLVDHYWQRGQYDKALAIAKKLVERMPKSAAAHQALGKGLLGVKDRAGARQAYEQAFALDPFFMTPVEALVILDLQDNKPDAARQRFVAAIEKNPKAADASVALAQLMFQADLPDADVLKVLDAAIAASPSSMKPRVAKIAFLSQRDKTREAMEAAKQAQSVIPDSPEVLLALAKLQVKMGEASMALTTYGKLQSAMPGSAAPYVGQADVHIASRDWNRAREALARAAEVEPESKGVQTARFGMEVRSGRTREALDQARFIQKKWPRDVDGYDAEAQLLLTQNDRDGAERVLRAGVSETGQAELVTKLVAVLVANGKAAQGEELANKWYAAHPNDAWIIGSTGTILLGKGDFRGAEVWLRRAVQLLPDNLVLLNNFAWVLGKLQHPEAIAVANRALQKAPESAEVLDTVGSVHVEAGQVEKGIELLTKALAVAPGSPSAHIHMARALVKVGRKDEARKHVDAAAKSATSGSLKKEIEEVGRSL